MALQPYMLMTHLPEVVDVIFRFQINGTSDPDFCFPAGAVKDIVRSGVGVFVVEFYEKYAAFIGAVGSVQEATPTHDLIVKNAAPSDYDSATGKLTVRVVGADGTPAAEDPADNDYVFVRAVMCRRTVLNSAAGAI